jgi:chloride channel protein, CIC family
VSVFSSLFQSNILSHPRQTRYTALVREDLTQTYSRDIQNGYCWHQSLVSQPGLVISAITIIILQISWARILPFYLSHHWAIIPGLLAGFVLTGRIMQFRTPYPDQHSTEEIIQSYH